MKSRSCRILKYPWHTAHDYELLKLPHEFFFLTNTPRKWAVGERPIPRQVSWTGSHADQDTDVMILGVDQWSIDDAAKRYQFLQFKESYAGPKIVINHGCNMVDGCSSAAMATLIDGCYMVCNSPTAERLWSITPSRFIRHGMSPEEWPPTSYSRHRTLVVQAYSEAYGEYRNNVGVEQARARGVDLTWVGRDVRFSSFDAYRWFLRESSVLFNPSYASPNPRARTEAMLCGLAIVTTNAHGEDEYIRNGVNGFCSNDFDELISFLLDLQTRPAQARRLGMAGRETAQKFFHISRFIDAWNDLLSDYVG